MNDVTVVFTSCGRQDLLDISLGTFFAFNTYLNVDVMVVEDGDGQRNGPLAQKYAGRAIRWISTGSRIGQIGAIDFAYSHIQTPYIFHTEDDWTFHAPGFIEKALAILQARSNCLIVRIQALNELSDHPLSSGEEAVDGITFKRLPFDFEQGIGIDHYTWHGFSFNPGLRRLEDYQRIAPYAQHVGSRAGTAGRSEEALGKIFRGMGLYTAVLTDNGGRGYVRHIGKGRTVNHPLLYRVKRRIARLKDRYFDQDQRWAIGIYSGISPLEITPAQGVINPVLLAKDISDVPADFVADPFMVKENDLWYMFFEAMNSITGRGEIGYATSEDGYRWGYNKIVVREKFHLSYPYVFKWNNEYYMIPESHQVHAIRLYKATNFPECWSFVKDLIYGCYADSSVIFINGYWWLFTYEDEGVALHLYYAEDLLGPWIEHPQSPVVKKSAYCARPGGRLFIWEQKLFRLAQDGQRNPGNSVNAFEILELSAAEYKEQPAGQGPLITASGTGWNKKGMHNVDPHQISEKQWVACVDGFTSDWFLAAHAWKRTFIGKAK